MKESRTHRGFFAYCLRAVVFGALAFIFLLPQVVFAAEASSDLKMFTSVEDAKKAINFDSDNLPASRWYTVPSSISAGTSPKSAKVVVCQNEPCSPSSGGTKYEFTLSNARKLQIEGGKDVYDFTFTAAGTNLKFIYRTYPNGDGTPGGRGLVVGETDDKYAFRKNYLGSLIDFQDTALAKDLLEKNANDEGLAAFKEKGLSTTEDDATIFDKNKTNDPFAKAVGKLAEIMTSFTNSLVSALKWAMDVGALQNINGLVEGWKVIRDLVNLVFVLVLAAIAILTMLRIESNKYSVRATLPLLIVAVIGVNFSLFLATIMVNSAYILSQPFVDSAQRLIDGASSNIALGGGELGEAVVVLIASAIMMLALLILLFFFIARIIVIWLLAAFSPVLFLAMVLPLSRGESKKLLQMWVKWVYMAPIAFIVLYLGTGVAFTPVDVGDSGATAILKAIFYAGVVFAAVAIPIGIGGALMRALANQGGKAGKLGAKLGLGAFGQIPSGKGKTLSQRARTGKAFLEQAKASRMQDAALDAGQLRLRMADNIPGSGMITGMSDRQIVSTRQQLLEQAGKEMTPIGLEGQFRIVNAWQNGMEKIDGEMYAKSFDGSVNKAMQPLTKAELRMANNGVNAGAAYTKLAATDMSDVKMLKTSKIGRNYAWTGAQQQHHGDPRIQSVDLLGRENDNSMDYIAHHMNPTSLQGLDLSFLRDAYGGGTIDPSNEDQRRALRVLRTIDEVRLGNAVHSDHPFKFSTHFKREMLFKAAQAQVLSRSVSRQDFKDGKEGDDEYRETVKTQRNKEDRIQKMYRRGLQIVEATKPANPRGATRAERVEARMGIDHDLANDSTNPEVMGQAMKTGRQTDWTSGPEDPLRDDVRRIP